MQLELTGFGSDEKARSNRKGAGATPALDFSPLKHTGRLYSFAHPRASEQLNLLGGMDQSLYQESESYHPET